MRRWAKRLALVPLLIGGLYVALYLLPANLFLGTSLGPRLLSRNPQRLRVVWTSARSFWPGEVEVRGLRIDGDTARVRWALSIDHGQGEIGLPALLRRRFEVRGFEGTGVTARVSRHPPVPRTARRRRAPWTLRVDGARVAGLRALEYGPLRLTGDGRAAGSFAAVIGRQVEVDLQRLEMTGGDLQARDRTVARGLTLRADLRLGPYAPRQHPGAAGFDFLSGSLRASGAMEEVPVLRRVAGSSSLPPRPGRLAIDVRVERGSLVPGSRLALSPPSTQGSSVAATATVVRTPAGPRLRVEADLDGFTLPRRDGRPPILTSETLQADALTSELRLSRLIGQARDLRRGQIPAGWTLPAEVRARGLRLTLPGRRTSFELTAGEARGRIDLPALLRREVRLDELTGTAAHLRLTAVTPAPPSSRAPAAGRPPWTLQLARTRLSGSCDGEWGGLRLQGGLHVAGDLSWKDGLLTLDLGSIALSDTGLLQKGEPLVREVALAGAIRFGPYSPRRPGPGWIDLLSGTLEGHASTSLPALQRLSGSSSPDARLALDLRLDHGVLRPGTEARLVQTPLTLTAGVPSDQRTLHLRAALPAFTIRRRTGLPLLTTEALEATTEIPHLRIPHLLDLGRSLGGGGEGGGSPSAGDWQRGRQGLGESAHEGAEHGRPAPLAGWGLSPAEVHARGLRFTIPGERSSLELTATAGHGRLDLPALFQREARFTAVSLTGGRLRLQPGTGEPQATPDVLPGAPPPWKASLADARLTGDCQVDLGGFGFTSSLQAAGDLTWSGEALAIERLTAQLAGGLLRRDGETVAQDMSLLADARLDPFDPSQVEGLSAFRLVTGHWQLGGAVGSLGFLRPYLEKASWLELDGSGSLDADLRVDRGRLLPGSRFSVRPALLRAGYLLSRASGVADLHAIVEPGPEGERLRVGVHFDRFAIAARDVPEDQAHVSGRDLRLSLVTRDLDLTRAAKDLRVRLDLPEADVTDLTFYNGYLPPGSEVEILAGKGRLSSWLEMETAGQTGRGEVMLRSDRVRVRLYDMELAGALSLAAPLASPDLKGLRFGLDGTRLDLRNVAVREISPRSGKARVTPPGWWARLDLTKAEMDWTRPMSLTGSIDLAMRDSEVLLSLFSRRKRYLHWFRRALHIEDLAAQGDLTLDEGAVVLDRLIATGRGLEVRSRLRLSRNNPRGFLFLRRGLFRVGVELRDGRRHYRFRRPARWFDSRAAPEGAAAQ